MEHDPNKSLTSADRLMLNQKTGLNEDATKKVSKDFAGKLSEKQRKVFYGMNDIMNSIHDDLESARRENSNWTREGVVIAIVDRSMSISDDIRSTLKLKTGSYPFNSLRNIPSWLERPHKIDDSEPISLYDALLKIGPRVEQAARKTPLDQKEYFMDTFELTKDEYKLLSRILLGNLKEEEIDNAKNPGSTKYILQNIFTTNEMLVDEEFKKRQPVSASPNSTYAEKKQQQNLHKIYTKILYAFRRQTTYSLEDDDNETFEDAWEFVKEVKKIPSSEILIPRLGPVYFSYDWQRTIYTYYEETGDLLFKDLADKTLERYKEVENPRFYTADEINSEIKVESVSDQEIEGLNIQLRELYTKLMNETSLGVFIVEFNNETNPELVLGTSKVNKGRIFSMFDKEVNGRLEIVSDETKSTKKFSFDLSRNLSVVDIFVECIDPQKVSISIKAALARLILAKVEERISLGDLDKFFVPEAEEPKKITIPTGVLSVPGPSKTQAKETKRTFKSQQKDFPKLAHGNEPKDKIRPTLEIPTAAYQMVQENFGNNINNMLKRALEIYQKGGGVIKILKNLITKNHEHILSVRVGSEYRALFAIGENNQGRFLEFYNRRDQAEVVSKYRN